MGDKETGQLGGGHGVKGFVAGPCYGAGGLPVGTVDLVDSLES